MRENLNLLHMTNKGTDQPAHLRSLIRTFGAHFMEIMMAKLPTFKISTSQLVSVAEQPGLSLWKHVRQVF